jgi:hypothetical protein
MTTRLIPLADIPHAARAAERHARAAYTSRAAALEAAQYRLDVAPGCHGRPYFDPPVIGWCVSRAAAAAMVEQVTHMPGGTCHRRVACRELAAAGVAS